MNNKQNTKHLAFDGAAITFNCHYFTVLFCIYSLNRLKC